MLEFFQQTDGFHCAMGSVDGYPVSLAPGEFIERDNACDPAPESILESQTQSQSGVTQECNQVFKCRFDNTGDCEHECRYDDDQPDGRNRCEYKQTISTG